ncbi:DUF1064 domain-containing protein [Rhizorhabdus wittichii]|uniref:DUF1064 domain-containing protein n=1 Tax=Rhizorhabdus wittichii TaxID=160791 RepID=UPI0003645C54|nr:DUF1064 domain-containing protein [Rhizorhabdus wittichii]
MGGNKFHAKRTPCHQGHTHASGREAKRCNDLTLLARAGEISDLEQQPKFRFELNGRPIKHETGRAVIYTADFGYRERGKAIVEDAKGSYRDDAWRLRKAFFRAFYPDLELREV